MILCRHCGSQIYPNQKFCLDCGGSVIPSDLPAPNIIPPSAQLTEQTKARSASTLLIVIGLLATAAVSVAVTVLLLSDRSGDQFQGETLAAKPLESTGRASTSNTRLSAQSSTELRITATASSTRTATIENSYEASNVLDQRLETAWDEGVGGPGIGQWIQCDFNREVVLRRIHITPDYFKNSKSWLHNNRLAAATFYFSNGSSRRFNFPDRMEEQSLEVGQIKIRWVRMNIDAIYAGSVDNEDTLISQLTFDWEQ